MSQINILNKSNEVRGRFIQSDNPSKLVNGVKAYLAEFKNGKWVKQKNIEYAEKRAVWNQNYSFPARESDNRAVFFEHADYAFSPTHIRVGDYSGSDSRTVVRDVFATKKSVKKGFIDFNTESQMNFITYDMESRRGELFYNLDNNGLVNLSLYDLSGRLIDKVISQSVPADSNRIEWQLTNKIQGIFVIQGFIAKKPFSQKMIF